MIISYVETAVPSVNLSNDYFTDSYNSHMIWLTPDLTLIRILFPLPLFHTNLRAWMTLLSRIWNERIQERKKQTYVIRGGYLVGRMSLCNNSNEIITKSNIFRTEMVGTEASSPKICPFKILSCLIVLTEMNFKSAAKRKKWFLHECSYPIT